MSDFDLDLFETNCPTFNKKKDCPAVAMPNGEGGAKAKLASSVDSLAKDANSSNE